MKKKVVNISAWVGHHNTKTLSCMAAPLKKLEGSGRSTVVLLQLHRNPMDVLSMYWRAREIEIVMLLIIA